MLDKRAFFVFCLQRAVLNQRRVPKPRIFATGPVERHSRRRATMASSSDADDRAEPRHEAGIRRSPVTEKYVHAGVIERLVKDGVFSEGEAVIVFRDTIRFLDLCGTTDESLAPTESIDKCWHQFLLFTKDYADFCRVFYGKFIHHSPDWGAQKTDNALGRRMLQLFAERFGTSPGSALPASKTGTVGSRQADCSDEPAPAPEPSCREFKCHNHTCSSNPPPQFKCHNYNCSS